MMKLKEKEAEFSYLGLADYELLEQAVRRNATESLKSAIANAKLGPNEAFAAWRDARPDLVSPRMVHAYVRETRDGVVAVLDKSLEKSGVSSERRQEIIASYTMLDAGNLAATLVGFETRVDLAIGGQSPPLTENPAS